MTAPAAPTLKQSAVGGFFWLSSGNAIRGIVKLLVLAVLARLLSPADFGLVSAAGVVIWLSSIFANLGVGPALVQRDRLERRHVETGFASSLILGLAFVGVIYLTAPYVAAFFRMERLSGILRALAWVFPIGALATVAESLLQRALRFGTIAAAELASYVIGYGVVGIGLAFAGAGVWALVGAAMTKSVLKSILFLRAVPHEKSIRLDRRALAELLRFGSGYTATSLSTYFANQGDNLVIGRFLGAASLGVYGRAFELMVVPATALGTILNKVLFPTFSKLQEDPERLRLGYRHGLAFVAMVVLPIAAATIIFAPEIILTLLGPQWNRSVLPLRILAVAMYFRVGYQVSMAVANSSGAVFRAAWRTAVYAGLVVLGALIGQRWGLPGVSVGVVLAVTVNFAMLAHLNHRITGLSWRAWAGVHIPPLSLNLAVGVALWALAGLLRGAGVPAPLILIAAAAVALTTTLLLWRLSPTRLVGPDGLWLLQLIHRSAPRPLRPLLRTLLNLPT